MLQEDIMNPLAYLKAITGACGAGVFLPLAHWAVSYYIPAAPDDARQALCILIVALLTGGAVYTVPNQSPGSLGAPVDQLR